MISSGGRASERDVERVHRGLMLYNEAHAGPSGFRKVQLLVHDKGGAVKGGLLGKHVWHWLHVEALWVEESLRGQGLGSRLLVQAEVEAREAGCTRVLLDTFEFQAPAFYAKRGYEVVATLDDFPPGFRRYYLKKELTP